MQLHHPSDSPLPSRKSSQFIMSQSNTPQSAVNVPMQSSTQNQTTSPENTQEITPTPTPQTQTSGREIFKTIFSLRRDTPPATARRNAKRNSEENERLSDLILQDVTCIKNIKKDLGKCEEVLDLLLSQDLPKNREDLAKLQTEDLKDLRKKILQLKLQIPTDEKHSKKLESFRERQQSAALKELLKLLPNLYEKGTAENSMEFHDLVDRYNKLDSPGLKLCLLCFSVFPENAIIKKRLMLHWWVAEGFVDDEGHANKYFLELIERGFIQPVNENQNSSIKSCRIHPFCRTVLVKIADKIKFFNFDSEVNPSQNFAQSLRSCLVGKGLFSEEDKASTARDLQNVRVVFNVKERTLDLEPFFSKMKNVTILHLGRWLPLRKDHPVNFKTDETEDEKKVFMGGGSVDMKYLKFLSLCGVSNFHTLNGASIAKMENLKFLDLKDCDDLKKIPSEIQRLRSLTHLDISDCNSLKKLPKELSQLTQLMVLKGFVIVSDSPDCTLDDLKTLKKLIKLSLFIDSGNFPNSQHLKALEEMEELRKLTVNWNTTIKERYNSCDDKATKLDSNASRNDETMKLKSNASRNNEAMKLPSKLEKLPSKLEKLPSKLEKLPSKLEKLPSKLEKLDLRVFPTTRKSRAPKWLQPGNLKKLYITGGEFSDLGQYQEIDDGEGWSLGKKETWKVEKLRLRHLHEMEIEWDQLRELFPNLDYLEHLDCPKLSLFPCHTNECGGSGEANVTNPQDVSFTWKKTPTS